MAADHIQSCRLLPEAATTHVKLKIQTSQVWASLQQGRIVWEESFKTTQFVLMYLV